MRKCRNTGRHGSPAVNGGTKVPISGRVIAVVIVGAVVEAVTPISVETGLAMDDSTTVDTLAPIEGADACVTRACEEDYDDGEAPLLGNLVIVSKALPLLKCMHKNANFS